jgi:zinc transport system substrate-binding protein
MKHKLIIFLLSFLIIGLFGGCGSPESSGEEDKLSVVATIFPAYDWTRSILGEEGGDAELTLLLDNGVDLHSYQPSMEDIVKISDCDLLIYVGGESDAWVSDALDNATNKNMKVVSLLDVLGDAAKVEPDTEDERDEHVWLSLKNAEVFCNVIAGVLGELAPEHADAYMSNASAYIEELSALDSEYRETVDRATRKTVLFGDRFPFRYLTEDYGLSYFAAFEGCSAETEASFETISSLAHTVDELGLPCVLTTENAEKGIAETIIQNTAAKNQKILILDSLQSVTLDDAEEGVTYLSVMEQNLFVLKEALN